MQLFNDKWYLLSNHTPWDDGNLKETITENGYWVMLSRFSDFDAVAQCFVKLSGTGTFNVTITPYLTAYVEDGASSLISLDAGKNFTGTGTVYGNLDNNYLMKGYFVVQVAGLTAGQSLNMRIYK